MQSPDVASSRLEQTSYHARSYGTRLTEVGAFQGGGRPSTLSLTALRGTPGKRCLAFAWPVGAHLPLSVGSGAGQRPALAVAAVAVA